MDRRRRLSVKCRGLTPFPFVPFEVDEIEQIVKTEVLKREIVEGEEAEAAQARINKFYRKSASPRRKKKQKAEPQLPLESHASEESVTDRLLREAEEQKTSKTEN